MSSALSLLVCLAFAATFAPAAVTVPRTITVEERDDGGTVQLARGDALVVRLAATLGTGYGWTVTARPDVLAQSGEPVLEPPEDGGLEHQRFKFDAIRPGSGALVLELRRPWEKTAPPLRTFHVEAVVH